MTDPRDPNQVNPLRMRVSAPWPFPTLGQMDYGEHEKNWLALMRDGGAWTDRFYSKNENVWFEGAWYLATADITAGSGDPYDNASWRLQHQPGIGGMNLATPSAALVSIGAGWTPWTAFDTIDITPVGCTLDVTTNPGQFSFQYRGTWNSAIIINFTQTESNAGRTTFVRLFNLTANAELARVPIPIARNQPGTYFFAAYPVLINTGNSGDVLRYEIGGGDSVDILTVESSAIDLQQLIGGKA